MMEMSLPEHWKILSFTDCLKRVKTKKKPSIPKRDYQESGEFPVIDQGASFIAGWTDSAESVISDNLPVVIFGDHTRIFKYVDFPFALGADGTQLLYPNDEILDPHFFYYALLNLKVPNKG
ncbi:MAG: restriction endonuclease subunit S, partial [Candidatus Poribacteria bacterium]|nr:restriction endonuclease subunit S [Candidatus Poribacteria bacterium]